MPKDQVIQPAEPTKVAVDIYKYPIECQVQPEGTRVVLGDLDGNAMKFLHQLLREGVIVLPAKPALRDQYETELLTVYKAGTVIEGKSKPGDICYFPKVARRDDLLIFSRFLEEAVWTNSKPRLRLIGDDLCDRGSNDLYTLGLFKELDRLKVECDVIASNHGLDFLRQFFSEGGIAGELVALYPDSENPEVGIGKDYFGHSLNALRDCLDRGLVAEKYIEDLVRKHYLPKVKLLAYDVDNEGVLLYTHAPVNADQVRALFYDLKKYFPKSQMEFAADSPEDLMRSIALINKWFSEIITHSDPAIARDLLKTGGVLDHFVNGRFANLEKSKKGFGNFAVKNIHGHVGAIDFKVQSGIEDAGWSHINIDSDCGMKDPVTSWANGEDQNRGEYRVYRADASNTPLIENSFEVNEEPQLPRQKFVAGSYLSAVMEAQRMARSANNPASDSPSSSAGHESSSSDSSEDERFRPE